MNQNISQKYILKQKIETELKKEQDFQEIKAIMKISNPSIKFKTDSEMVITDKSLEYYIFHWKYIVTPYTNNK